MSEETLKLEKEIRKLLKLPTTKELIYYDVNNNIHKIKSYKIDKEYETFKIIEIKLENNKRVKIHSDYLKEMQQTNFIELKEKEKCAI